MKLDRSDDQRVVITGLGAITPLGHSTRDLWEGLLERRSGVGLITRFDASAMPTRIAGEVKNFDPAAYMNRKEVRRMARCSHFAIAAMQEALADAGLAMPFEGEIEERAGVFIGTALGGFDMGLASNDVMRSKGWGRVNPFSTVATLPNMPSHHVSRMIQARGPNATIVTACASGTQSIGEATEVIRRGAADVMLGGGVEGLISDFMIGAFSAMRALSTRNDEPEKASRPFDKDRDGFILSEGCGVVVLESLAHARRRGARIYAEVLGQASSSDAYHVAAPDPEGKGAACAMRWALKDAGLDVGEVSYINAHGPGTPQGDAAETLAIKAVFGQHAYTVPISSTKSMIGHCMGGAGAVEAIVCALTIARGVIHPTVNCEVPDPDCDLDYVPGAVREQPVRTALSNSFGLGGQNACLVLGRVE